MKFDMHCHTKEGSIDGQVPIEEYIIKLKKLGYKGMLVSDHNSYNGYRYWKDNIKGKRHNDFVVLKGVEYDTSDAGHILVIMPENVKLKILEIRGLPVQLLIAIVHLHGGILGPAHPCGEKFLSITNTRKYRHNYSIFNKFDFIERFNSCESAESNHKAKKIALRYDKIGLGGSDSHKLNCIGTAFTEFPDDAVITCETELIAYIKNKEIVTCGGVLYKKTTKEKMGKANKVLVGSFWFYNKIAWFFRVNKRNKQLEVIKEFIQFKEHHKHLLNHNHKTQTN